MDFEKLESKVDKIDIKLTEHIRESEAIRVLVNRHENKLSNGWAKEMADSLNELKLKMTRLEEKLTSKGAAWKDIAFGTGLVATLLGIAYTVIQISRFIT
jgi:hypothetical protein